MGPLTLHNISEAHMSGQYCLKRTFLTDFVGGISVRGIIQGLFFWVNTQSESFAKRQMQNAEAGIFFRGSSDMLLNL